MVIIWTIGTYVRVDCDEYENKQDLSLDKMMDTSA